LGKIDGVFLLLPLHFSPRIDSIHSMCRINILINEDGKGAKGEEEEEGKLKPSLNQYLDSTVFDKKKKGKRKVK
jgi:hypothetical protein